MLGVFQFHTLDLRKAAGNLVAGYAHFAHVGMGLLDMAGEFLHPVVKARKVFRQFAKLILDHMCHAPRFSVAQHSAYGIQYRHQRGGRGNPDALALGVLDQITVATSSEKCTDPCDAT